MCICIGAHMTFKLASTLGLEYSCPSLPTLGILHFFRWFFVTVLKHLEGDCSAGHVVVGLCRINWKKVSVSAVCFGWCLQLLYFMLD